MERTRYKNYSFENNQKENPSNSASIIRQSNPDLIVFHINQNDNDKDNLNDNPTNNNQIKNPRIRKNKQSSKKSLKMGARTRISF